ncbi:GlxA family transcriptional regulator [Glycomyces sp. NRRL B-16210]|uniref:GlxA family transcriptional regulator n=1 Tax=Glycomyces sp. NRRL B-16210 TaxID=1463821 RepID=UPI000690DB5D|nr:helix-turn-helix domain-containing protein [Glycomyces sp. NRRL B-16210]
MSVFRHPGRHRVAVLVRHGLLPVELGIAHRVFGTARASSGERLYEVATCAVEPGEIRTDADVTVNVRHGIEALAEADTVIVPSEHEQDAAYLTGRLPGPLAEAFAAVPAGARVASICTGSFALAAAGLLDGKRATTHWDAVDRFRRLFPRVRLEPEVLYTEDGGVFTSAGVASGFDLCLHLTRLDFGAAVANAVARLAVVPPHRDGGQAQFIERPVPEPEANSTSKARSWALERLYEPISLRQLAECEAMSVRTFTRRFREEVGTSPQRWLLNQRIGRARHLLERSDRTIDQVAAEAGFGSASSLRLHFQAALGVSPSAYRRTFAGG